MKIKYKALTVLMSAVLCFTSPIAVFATADVDLDSSTTTEDQEDSSATEVQGDSSSSSVTKYGIDSLEVSNQKAPELSAETAVMIDATTGVVLYDKQSTKRMYPASMTKVISAIVALNHGSLSDKVTFSDEAVNSLEWDAMNIGVSVGETLSLQDAIIGMLLPSANECANGVAEFIGGSNEGFADMMNEWAASVGAENSHFVTPSGLFDYDHYTTAYDMAIMARAALENSDFLALEAHTQYNILAESGDSSRQIEVFARHEMADEEGFVAGKTGFEDLAGYTLMTCMERNGLRLIVVVMNAEEFYADTAALFEYGFSNFEASTTSAVAPSLFSSQAGSGFYSMFNSDFYPIVIEPTVPLIAVKDMIPSHVSVTASYDLTNAPVTAEDAIGYATFTYGELCIGYAPIIKQSVEVSSPIISQQKEEDSNGFLSTFRRLPPVLKVFCVILLIVLILLLLAVLLFLGLVIRKQLVLRKRKKMRALREARRRQAERKRRRE